MDPKGRIGSWNGQRVKQPTSTKLTNTKLFFFCCFHLKDPEGVPIQCIKHSNCRAFAKLLNRFTSSMGCNQPSCIVSLCGSDFNFLFVFIGHIGGGGYIRNLFHPTCALGAQSAAKISLTFSPLEDEQYLQCELRFHKSYSLEKFQARLFRALGT